MTFSAFSLMTNRVLILPAFMTINLIFSLAASLNSVIPSSNTTNSKPNVLEGETIKSSFEHPTCVEDLIEEAADQRWSDVKL